MATPPLYYYVYVVMSQKDRHFYVGSTCDLKRRIKQHLAGTVDSTKNRLPTSLVFYEAYLDKFDALRREDYFKTTKGKRTLRNMLKEYLRKLNS